MSSSNPPRPAAAILLSRGSKIWLGHRGGTRFLPGFSVFPGGASEKGESYPETALRELQEETGLELETQHLSPFARAITPDYSKYRFDVRVYRAELPEGQEPLPDGMEFVSGEWHTPEEILNLRARGALQLAPPTYRQVLQWQNCHRSENWPSEIESFGPPPPLNEQILPFLPDLTLVPLRTGALPPAAWTNTALIGATDFFVLDPGGREQNVLQELIRTRQDAGHKCLGVLLSHHHQDHIDGTHLLPGPVYCHSVTAGLLSDFISEPKLLDDGAELRAGDSLLRFHFTPGHAPGHLAVELPAASTVLAGDMLSSLSSIVIPQDSGNLMDFLRSLEVMRALQCNLVMPAHGPPFGKDSDPFGQALRHRARREQQVVAILNKGPRDVDGIVDSLYPGLQLELRPAATANVNHYLQKLETEGRAVREVEKWALQKA